MTRMRNHPARSCDRHRGWSATIGVLFFRGVLFCAAMLWSVTAARAEPLSVKEFNDKLRQWKADGRLSSPVSVHVEGRVLAQIGKNHLRLKNCKDVLFVSSQELPELMRKSVEVSGKVSFDRRSGEYQFAIGSIREIPSDVEKFHDSRRRLRDQPAEKWYELGQWAESRGKFYNDHELQALSEEAYSQGFELERKSLARDNPEGLLKLAEKARIYRVSLKLRQELTHEAFHLLCERSRDQPAAALEELANNMSQVLTGCTKPLKFLPTDLIKKYQAKPLETYASADVETRVKIHRLMYSEIIMRTITPRLAADGSNGFEVAEQIDKLVPEQHALAESYRDKALSARASDVDKFTKSEMLELAEKYRTRKQQRQSDQLIETWLTLRIRALDPDDTEGLLDLTEEYRRLLKRNDVADRLLIDGWKRNPKAADIIERLQNAGYHLFEGNWLSESEFTSRPEGRLEKAIREGRIEAGMSDSHVRRAHGQPDFVVRAVTAGQVTEVWNYTLAGSSHLVVRLVRKGTRGELTVVDVARSVHE